MLLRPDERARPLSVDTEAMVTASRFMLVAGFYILLSRMGRIEDRSFAGASMPSVDTYRPRPRNEFAPPKDDGQPSMRRPQWEIHRQLEAQEIRGAGAYRALERAPTRRGPLNAAMATLVVTPIPDNGDLTPSAAHDEVETTIVCVLTRFGLRRPWHLIQTYLAYRWLMSRVRRKQPDGLLRSTFLIENASTCFSLSIWADESAIPHFGTSLDEHVEVARSVFGRLRFQSQRPEIWSTRWRLSELSNNLCWGDFDLRGAVESARTGRHA